MFADALRSAEDIEYVAEHVDAPLIVNMGFASVRLRLCSRCDMVSYPRVIIAAVA